MHKTAGIKPQHYLTIISAVSHYLPSHCGCDWWVWGRNPLASYATERQNYMSQRSTLTAIDLF